MKKNQVNPKEVSFSTDKSDNTQHEVFLPIL